LLAAGVQLSTLIAAKRPLFSVLYCG